MPLSIQNLFVVGVCRGVKCDMEPTSHRLRKRYLPVLVPLSPSSLAAVRCLSIYEQGLEQPNTRTANATNNQYFLAPNMGHGPFSNLD